MQLSNISPIFRVCSVMVARDIWVIEEAFESHIFYCTVSVSGLARKSVDLQGRVRVPYRTFSHIQQAKKDKTENLCVVGSNPALPILRGR